MQEIICRNFEQSITEAMDKYNAPGIAASLIINGDVAFSKTFGVSKIGDTVAPITTSTIFAIMSIAKSFTATAIMQLAEKEEIDLNSPVSTYLPYFYVEDEKYKKSPITIKQLLSHTAGFSEYFWVASLQDQNLVKLIRGVPQYEGILNDFPDHVLKKIRNREDVTRYFSNAKLHYNPGEGWQYCLCNSR